MATRSTRKSGDLVVKQGEDEQLSEVVRKGILKHKNPSNAELMAYNAKVNANIRRQKDLVAGSDDADFQE